MDEWQLMITWGDKCFWSQEWCSLKFHLYFFGLQDVVDWEGGNDYKKIKWCPTFAKKKREIYIKKQLEITCGLQEYLWGEIWSSLPFFHFTPLFFIISELMEATCSGRLSRVLTATVYLKSHKICAAVMGVNRPDTPKVRFSFDIGENTAAIKWMMQGGNSA